MDRATTLINALSSTKYLSIEIEDYIKKHPQPLCKVLIHHEHEECIYTEIPRKSLANFIKEEMKKQSTEIKK